MMTATQTMMASTILDAAQRITQAVGYNGLSFRDVAAAIGIKSASVHYHFPSKEKLGAALVRRYTDALVDSLDGIDGSISVAGDRINAYIQVFRETLERDGLMCLGGMLASEADALPPEVRAEVGRFIDANVAWIAGVIAHANGTVATNDAVRNRASALFATLEGAMLLARGAGGLAQFDAVAAHLLDSEVATLRA